MGAFLEEYLVLLLFTLLPRLKMTLLPLDFDHFTPNIDNFTPIQKGYLPPKVFILFRNRHWGIRLVKEIRVKSWFFVNILEEKNLINYRRFNDTFTLHEGSDFDIEIALKQTLEKQKNRVLYKDV